MSWPALKLLWSCFLCLASCNPSESYPWYQQGQVRSTESLPCIFHTVRFPKQRYQRNDHNFSSRKAPVPYKPVFRWTALTLGSVTICVWQDRNRTTSQSDSRQLKSYVTLCLCERYHARASKRLSSKLVWQFWFFSFLTVWLSFCGVSRKANLFRYTQ